jgi:hypothetical protein
MDCAVDHVYRPLPSVRPAGQRKTILSPCRPGMDMAWISFSSMSIIIVVVV